MREFVAYLNKEEDRDVDELRMVHLLSTLDNKEDGVRLKVLGEDFFKTDIEGDLPYVFMDGKKKSWKNLWKAITGEVRNDI
jgi:hypothetical protein|tara:strand:- start:320 stop:562 length:243 start_codon:yes stop_codon:yes gene_type:complete